MTNPGRYLTLLPPINGADAISGSPYFTANLGDKAHMYDATATFDYMPSQWLTFRAEMGYRHSDVPYFSGRGGITPPGGLNNAFGNTGSPGLYVCTNGLTSGCRHNVIAVGRWILPELVGYAAGRQPRPLKLRWTG